MDSKSMDIISTVIYLLPIAGLIWKAALQSAELKELRKDVDENIAKFCKDHRNMEDRIEHERLATDSSISTMLNSLHKIELAITRIEATVEAQKEKNDDR